MDLIAYILDGLEAELELERELGVRSVEIDRSLLTAAPDAADARRETRDVRRESETRDGRRETTGARQEPGDSSPVAAQVRRLAAQSRSPAPARPREPVAARPACPLVFLHDRPLSPAGAEMMDRIVTARGEAAVSVVAPPGPKARVVVVLGGREMKLYYPEMKGEPGQWFKAATGEDVLVTYSPEYILRFGVVTPAVEKLKRDMWRSLKAVLQRLR